MVRLRVLTADKRMPLGDASAGLGEGLRTGRREEKTKGENPQHKSNTLARENASLYKYLIISALVRTHVLCM